MQISRRSFLVMALAAAACKRGAAIIDLSGTTMGTSYTIVALDDSRRLDKQDVAAAVDGKLARVTALMSNWDTESEVSRFNAQRSTRPMQVSAELVEVVAAAQQVNRASDGQFDITLGPVIEAWGFGSEASGPKQPDAQAQAVALSASGRTQRIAIDGSTLRKTDPDTKLFLSSIGKGFGVDEVARTLKSMGLTDFMVEIGGDLYTAGINPDAAPWQIGIESPDALSQTAYRIAKVSGLGMATSGDYRNYFEQDGQRYSHILDAHTGRPITHRTASVTVLAENAMFADAWATALLALGSERGMEIAQDQQLAAFFIDRSAAGDFSVRSSDRFASLQA